MRPVAGPRIQPFSMVHGSRCAFEKSGGFELFLGPVAGVVELAAARQARSDAIGEVRQVGFQFRLVAFDLLHDFRVHIGDRIGLRRLRLLVRVRRGL